MTGVPQLTSGPGWETTNTFSTQADPEQEKKRTKREKALDLVKAYGRSPEVLTRFSNMLGSKPGKRYVESVIIAVQENEELLDCSPKSIFIAAMRAANLQLSVDPALRQAHLVKYKDEVKFIPDYHGLVQLSSGTGMYIDPPNVTEVYEGEEVEVNRFSGRVTITGTPTDPLTIQGWVAYYKDIYGSERFLYMSNEKCDAHAAKYNPGGFYSKKTPWATDRDKMRRKTCLRVFITQWGYFSPSVKNIVFADEDGEIIEGEAMDMPEVDEVTLAEKEQKPEGENLKDLGFNPDPVKDATWDRWQKLTIRATRVKVPYAKVKRDSSTDTDLQAACEELERFVLDAEDQSSVQ